ncbi:MAG TPA: hypothetical protein VK501_13980 [Baekduia sp.]|uniref:hypothetical protein n=1 Tax=Baekduia sp. TaxID=2600305 RepID=UPI002CF276A1|nr:hypothetical protein [Baekduia sp.]HMJ35017.1 hypothetical protein [Baekduia sp.]
MAGSVAMAEAKSPISPGPLPAGGLVNPAAGVNAGVEAWSESNLRIVSLPSLETYTTVWPPDS